MPWYRVVTVNPDGTANVYTPAPADLPTATAYAAANGGEVLSQPAADALVKNGQQINQAEIARLNALLPADSDGTSAMTVSEYRWNLAGVYQGLATLVTAGSVPTQAQLNLKEKWKYIFQFLESLDQARRVNPKVPPLLTITNAAFADGFITQAKRDYLNNFTG